MKKFRYLLILFVLLITSNLYADILGQVKFYNDKDEQVFTKDTYIFKCEFLPDYNIYETEHLDNNKWVKEKKRIGYLCHNDYDVYIIINYDMCEENIDGTLSSLKNGILFLDHLKTLDNEVFYEGEATIYIIPKTANDTRDVIRKERYKAVLTLTSSGETE